MEWVLDIAHKSKASWNQVLLLPLTYMYLSSIQLAPQLATLVTQPQLVLLVTRPQPSFALHCITKAQLIVMDKEHIAVQYMYFVNMHQFTCTASMLTSIACNCKNHNIKFKCNYDVDFPLV